MSVSSRDTPDDSPNPGPIRLRPFTESDFERMIAWADSPGFLLQWTGKTFAWPLDRRQLTRYLAESRVESSADSSTDSLADSSPDSLADSSVESSGGQSGRILNSVVDSVSGELIGHIGFALVDPVHRSARLSCVLVGAQGRRGQGLGEAAVREMCRIGFDELALHRIDLGVWELNPGAIACYEKVGFKKEGLFRDLFRLGDGYRNIFQMSLLEDEWRLSVAP